MNFKKIAKALTGFSTPVFGISWHPPESDRQIIRKLITFLEDRRALYNPHETETPRWVIESVLEIRKKLTDTLSKLDENSDISQHLRGMRAACRKFLDETEKKTRRTRAWWGDVFTALGEMRAVFGMHIAQLCVKYGINVEGDLASILPLPDLEQKSKRKAKQ